jgi:hypothetical protein
MAKTVELLYSNGILVDIWESKKGEPRQFGRAETPENGYIVVRLYGRLKDVPPALLECDGKACRFPLDVTKMSADEQQLFTDMNRYQFKAHAIKHTITWQRLVKLCIDNTTAWEAKKIANAEKAKRVGL